MKFEVGKVYNNKKVVERREKLKEGNELDVQITFEDGTVKSVFFDDLLGQEYYEEEVLKTVQLKAETQEEEPTEVEEGVE